MLLIYTVMAANYSAEMSIAMLVVSFAVLGAVFGIGGGPLGGRMIENVPDSDRAGASSILSFIMCFSSALGTALFSGLFNLGPEGEGARCPIWSPPHSWTGSSSRCSWASCWW